MVVLRQQICFAVSEQTFLFPSRSAPSILLDQTLGPAEKKLAHFLSAHVPAIFVLLGRIHIWGPVHIWGPDLPLFVPGGLRYITGDRQKRAK